MSFGQNSSGYCTRCGSSNGCSCNCSGGYDYSTCSPDYNPVTVNSSVCPNLEGGSSSCQGGSASGNNSSVHVSVGGCGCQGEPKRDCCCKDGTKKLLDYLYKKSLDDPIKTNMLCIYGNIIPSDISTTNMCNGTPLLSLTPNISIQLLSITDDLIKFAGNRISICAMSVIKFTFIKGTTVGINNDNELRREFFYTPKCKCSCNCGDGIAQALYLNGLGNEYRIELKDTILIDPSDERLVHPFTGFISPVQLVAVDSCIAIFSWVIGEQAIYYGIPTCKIAKFSA